MAGTENHIYIQSNIGKHENDPSNVSLEDVKKQHNPKAKKVTIHINSNGGEVPEGRAIYDFIKEISNKQKVHTIGEGMVASIATLAFLAGETREMKPNCEFLGHLPSMQAEGNSDDFARVSEYMQEKKRDIAGIYAEHTEQSLNEMIDFMRKDRPISAKKAMEMGFVTFVPEFKAVAIYNPENMSDTKKDSKMDQISSKMDDALKQILALLSPKDKTVEVVKNVSLELADGSMLFVESDDGELEGKSIWIADADGEPTEDPAPDGTHELTDGRSITVEAGKVVSVQEAMNKEDDEEAENFKKKIAALEDKLKESAKNNDDLTLKNTELSKGLKESKETIEVVTNKVNNLVVGDWTPQKVNVPVNDGKAPPTGHALDGFASKLNRANKF